MFDGGGGNPYREMVERWNARVTFVLEIDAVLGGDTAYPEAVRWRVATWADDLRALWHRHAAALAALPAPDVIEPSDAPPALAADIAEWQARWCLQGPWLGHVALATLVAWARRRLVPSQLWFVPGDDLAGACCPLPPVRLRPIRGRSPSFAGWRGSVAAVRPFAQYHPKLRRLLPALARWAKEHGLPAQAQRPSALTKDIQAFIRTRLGGESPLELLPGADSRPAWQLDVRPILEAVNRVERLLAIPVRPRGRPKSKQP
ncbi:hypothetical protein [Caldinitratiruptor microaerophilus]|uniref:Uncharacterized protein n=1 Tax=Caldinitratiruptor microaerophilus TaxID=671077 RepID=A0AA35CIP9_9FIRM|nr:hypothetical protein [Caldinitratiruptor microaerophilus]BDG59925.1 hypothetical protein caldi_10150 [Caldinitratiruptor microaerophilus]